MARVLNFSAGPSCLPLEVLETAAAEMTNWHGCGMGVMEMSHRSKEYMSIINKATADLKELLGIPDNFTTMFLQGGGSLEFAAVPLNLLGEKTTANYLVTGAWSQKAFDEAKKYCAPTLSGTGKASNFTTVPEVPLWTLNRDAAYFHYCNNETIHGLEYNLPEEAWTAIGDMPVVSDMSSNFLSQPIDFSKHALIYAGAQKNAGPAGVCVVMARTDMLGHSKPITPTLMDYKTNADNGSMYNTPPTYAIYICGLYFDYMKRMGGLQHFQNLAREKSSLLYATIDESRGFYMNPVEPRFRSRMNVPFLIKGGNQDLEKKFTAEAKARGMVNLDGHRSVGGLRASLYNGLTLEGVRALCDFMREFQAANESS